MQPSDFKSPDPVAWCPGCGNFGIWNAMQLMLSELGKPPQDILLVSGIGQAAKLPHYIKANCFNGLHGRALPVAAAAKIANHHLTVIVSTGDGDCYGEGGNHLIHNIRRNTDITVIVHDNQVYGLTKGQASPTTEAGTKTRVQSRGVVLEPLHPLEMAIALGAGFVARGFSRETKHLAGLMLAAVKHKGLALIDVLQPCVVFNDHNTYDWYAKRVYKVNDDPAYSMTDKMAAYQKAAEWEERIPIGIIYQNEKACYEEKCGLANTPPLVEDPITDIDITEIIQTFS